MEADASFCACGSLLPGEQHGIGEEILEHAQELNPDDRKLSPRLSFTPGEAGAKWMEKSRSSRSRIPKLDLKKPKG
jgi:hypothetical protein